MTEKTPYTPPQLFQVDLNHEQAILSACSLLAFNPMAGGMDITCRSGGCKAANTGGTSDSGQRLS